MAAQVAVVVEEGARRTFASALDWPGWARASSSPQRALEALDAYRARYAEVLAAHDVATPRGALVVERTAGNATTDFGAPSAIAAADLRAMRAADRARAVAILRASWSRFEDAQRRSSPLARGPRGGGRTREAMHRHVTDAEVAYARGLGLRVAATDGDDELVGALRDRLVAVVLGTTSPEREGRWPLRYGVRRVAWHVLDHLFELEDRETS